MFKYASTSSTISSLTKLGNKLAFLVFDNASYKYVLWQSDGTDEGSFPVDDPNLKNVAIMIGNPSLHEFQNELYLSGSTKAFGSEIWVGTFECKNIWTGAINNLWENPGNWSCGTVPDENMDVVINSGIIQLNSNARIKSCSVHCVVIVIFIGTHYPIGFIFYSIYDWLLILEKDNR